eukprot:gene41941-45805_t
MSMTNTSNPLMYNWNVVEIRYCDGASVSGDKETPTVATDVVVSGCSAGGLATFLHCDHWHMIRCQQLDHAPVGSSSSTMLLSGAAARSCSCREQQLDHAPVGSSSSIMLLSGAAARPCSWAAAIAAATGAKAKVACMPDSGFFLDEQRAPGYHANMQNACVEAHTPSNDTWKCIFAQWSAAHIKTPTFPMQSQYATVDHIRTGGFPEFCFETDPDTNAAPPAARLNEFGRNLTALVKSQLLSQPQHGIFLDSCHHHCGDWDGSEIDGKLSGSALQEWYNLGSPKLPNKGFFNQNKPFPCDACCKPDN